MSDRVKVSRTSQTDSQLSILSFLSDKGSNCKKLYMNYSRKICNVLFQNIHCLCVCKRKAKLQCLITAEKCEENL